MIEGGRSVVNELIALTVVVLVVFVARIISKWIRLNSTFDRVSHTNFASRLVVGLKKLQLDDYVMTFTVALYIVTIYAIWLQVLWGNNMVTAEDIVDWTPKHIHDAVEGSKWGIVMEICKVTCVWCCKACLLILYFNMTKGLDRYHTAVVIVSIYVAIGYVVVMVCLLFVFCRPFHHYWRVPDGHSQCATYSDHMILDACLNITGDAAMLCLPIPLLIKAKLPRLRKLALLAVFGLGSLVIICAILNRITNFTQFGSLVYLNWYAGETATAVIVANVPHLWPIIARVFHLGSFSQSSRNDATDGARYPSQSKKHSNALTTTLSEERIAPGDLDGMDSKYSGNSQDFILEEKGRTTTKIIAGDWDKSETRDANTRNDVDAEQGYIMKTFDVKQYRHEV